MSSLFDNISAYQQGHNTYYKSPLYKSQLENQQTEDGGSVEESGSSIQQNTPAIDWTRPDSNISPETYQEYQSGLLNGNPNKLRQERLQEATARNKRILDGQNAYSKNAEQNWEALGLSPIEREEAIQESNRINTLSNEERLANFDARRKGNYETTIDDVDFAQAMSTMDIADIRGIYGKDAAEYAYQMRRNATQTASLAGARGVKDNDFISWGNLPDSALSIGAKTLDTIGSLQDAGDLAVATATHDDEAITKLATEDNFWHKGANWLRKNQSASIHEAEARTAQKDTLLDMREQQDIQENRANGQETSDAKTSAWLSKQYNNVSNLFDEKSTLFAKSAEILGDIVVGGIVAKGSAMLASGVSEAVVKSFVKKELLDAAKAKGLDAVKTAEGKAIKDLVEDRISSVGKQQAQNNISTYGKQALTKEANTSRIGLNEKINPLKEAIESKAKSDIAKSELTQKAIKGVGKEAERKAFSEGKDIARQRAEEILSSIGSKAATVGVTAHGANQEAMDSLKSGYSLVADMDDKQFSNTNKGKEIVDNLNQKYKVSSLEDGLKNPEYKAEYLKAKDKLAVDAAKDAYKNTFMASATVNAFTSGLEKKLGGVDSKAKSFKEHIKGFLGNTGKEAGEEFVESFSGEFNPKASANRAVDSQVYDPMDKALSEGAKGAIVAGLGSGGLSAAPLGKSATGKAIKAVGNQISKVAEKSTAKMQAEQVESEAKENQSLFGTSAFIKDGVQIEGNKGILGKTFDESKLGQTYKKAVDSLSNGSKVLKDIIDTHGKENYTQVIHSLYQGYAHARKALEDTSKLKPEDIKGYENIVSTYEAFQAEMSQAAFEDLADYNKELHQSILGVQAVVSDPNATDQQRTEALEKLNSNIKADEGFQKLTQSSLYAMLSQENNVAYDQVKDLPKEVSFLDGKKPEDYPHVYNSVSKALDQVGEDLKAGKITEEEAFAKYNVALSDLYKLKETNGTTQEKLSGAKNLLIKMQEHLHSIGRDFGEHSPFKTLLDEVNNWEEKGTKEDDVFYQKFFGSQGIGAYSGKYKAGLLDYANDFFSAKKSGNPFQSIGRLQKFYNSQVNKLSALNQMIEQMESDERKDKLKDSYSYKTDSKTIDGGINKFTNLNQARAYRNSVLRDMESFNKISQSLLQSTARNHTQKLKQSGNKVEPVQTNNLPVQPINIDDSNLAFEETRNQEQDIYDYSADFNQPNPSLPTTPVNENSNPKQENKTESDGSDLINNTRTVHSIRRDDKGNLSKPIIVKFDTKIKSLAATKTENGERIVVINPTVNKKDFDEYIAGKGNLKTSVQKQIVFAQLQEHYGITSNELDTLLQEYADKFTDGNIDTAAHRFIYEYEISHISNYENDSSVYKKAKEKDENTYLEDADVLAVELRANVDAIEAMGIALGLGSNIDEISLNLSQQKSREPEVVIAGLLPNKGTNLVQHQDSNYEQNKQHIAHTFAEMTKNTLSKYFPEIKPDDKTYTIKVPLQKTYNIQKDNPFVEVTKDTLTVHIPELVAKELIKYGFDIETNSFGLFVRTNANKIDSLSDEAVQSMIANKETDFSTEEGREIRNTIIDQMNDGTFDPEDSDNKLFAESLIPLVRGISQYFKGNQAGVFNRQKRRGVLSNKTNIDSLPRFLGFNFLTQLFNVSYGESGNIRIAVPEKVIKAFITAIPKGIIQTENQHFHSNFEEQLNQDGKAVLGVFNITEELKGKYSSQIELTENIRTKDYSAISSTKRDFVMSLGKSVFEELGFKTTNATSMVQEDSMYFSLGLEAYNFMLNNGMVQEYIAKLQDTEGNETTQTYTGFTWNNASILSTEEYEATRLLLGKSAKQDNNEYSRATRILNEKYGSSLYGSMLGLLRSSQSDMANSIFGDAEILHGVFISNIDDEINNTPSKGKQAENKDAKSKLTSGNNNTLKGALNQANSVAFEPDMQMFEFYDNHPELHMILNGAVPSEVNIDTLPMSEESKDVLRSRQLRVERDYGLMNTYRNIALATFGDFSKSIFRFAHKMAGNSRIMFEADLNPVESKIVREMFNPVEFSLNQDENGNTTVQGTIQPEFKVTKTNNPRTLYDLILLANSKRKQSNDAQGFILALAQALGIKVEKKPYQDIVSELQDELPKHQEMINMLWEAQQQGKGYKFDIDKAQSFYNKFGTGSSRAAKTLMAFAQYQYQNVKGKDNQYGKAKRGNLQFHLYLEADGIANGFYNILKQFSTAYSPAYVMAQKRTGNITLDILAQKTGKEIDKLEGARTLFGTYGIDDMYQHIAKTMENAIKDQMGTFKEIMSFEHKGTSIGSIIIPYLSNRDILPYVLKIIGKGEKTFLEFVNNNNFNPTLINELNYIRVSVNKIINAHTDSKEDFIKTSKILKNSLNNLFTYGQITLLGGVKGNALQEFVQAVYKGKFDKLSPESIKAFQRGLAKLGVTPAMYGGKLKGVSNQILTSLKPKFLSAVDNVFTGIHDVLNEPTDENWRTLGNSFSELRGFSLVLGLPSNLFTINGKHVATELATIIGKKDIQALSKAEKSFSNELNGLVELFNKNKSLINKRITNGIGKFLNETIQSQFEEHFNSISFTMQLNQSLFNVFMGEFTSKLPEFIKQRNKEKGYSELQGSTGITRKEVIQLMKQMKNIPIVGTAFSNNAELVDSLVDVGNSLIKMNGSNGQTNSTNISSNFGTGSGSNIKSDRVHVYHEGTQYEAAGASINTASVPSTEAMTLHLVQEAMNKAGKAFLNVFDGLDAKFQIRDEVGISANKETFGVHTRTNLLEAMFKMFNRSTFEEIKQDPLISDYMRLSMEIALLKNSIATNTALDIAGTLYTIKSLTFRAGELQELINNRNIQRLSGNPEENYQSSSEDKNQEFDNLRSKIISTYIDMISNNHAMRQLEANDLPLIVNQFGGSNTGYYHNIKQLTENGLGKRFTKFAENKGVDFNNQTAMAEVLSEFIKTDPELKSKYNQYVLNKQKELITNETAKALTYTDLFSEVKTVSQLQKVLLALKGRTIQDVTWKAIGELTPILTKLDSNSKIYTNLNDLIEDAKHILNVDETTEKGKNFILSLQDNTGGKYVAGVGIYINPNEKLDTMVHELIHSMTRDKFANYYSTNNKHYLSYGERQAIKTIETNARKFTNRMLLDSDVLDAVEKLRQLAINNKLGNISVDDAYSEFRANPAKATAINMQFAFEVLPTLENVSEADVLSFQEKVMNEFIAYGLTEADMLRELRYGKGESLTEVIGHQTSKRGKEIATVMFRHYEILTEEMSKVLGLSETSDVTKSAWFSILTSLNILADATRYPERYELSTLAGNTLSLRDVIKDSIINRRVEMIVDSQGTTLPEVLNKVSLFGSSPEHQQHLKEITSNIANKLQSDILPAELQQMMQQQDEEASDLVSNLRSSGLRMTSEEENAFSLIYTANKFALLGNKTLEQAGYSWLENVSQVLEPSVLGLSQTDFNKVVNPMRQTNNKLAYMLALVATNEQVRNSLEQFYKNKPTKIKDKLKQSLAFSTAFSKNLNVGNLTKDADVLMAGITLFNMKDYRSVKQAENQIKALELKQEKLDELAKMFGDFTDSKHIENLVKAMQSGQGTSPFNNDMDSVFTEAINEWINTYEKGKGRRTWIGTLVRLIVGSTSKTFQWYKAKNQNSTLLESIRERTTTTIPSGIRAKFDTITKADEKAIDKVLLPTSLHRIKNFSGVQDREVIGLLTNKKNADFEKAKVSGYIRSELMAKFGDKEGQRLYNIAMWQIKGLGSLMVTRQAKTSNVKESHYIMPNTRAISNLIKNTDSSIQEAIDTLTSIYALDYVEQADKNQIAELMQREPEAFNEMLDSVETMYAKSTQKASNSLLGEDGFVMNHRDSMSNVVVVDPRDSDTLSNLRKRGYQRKAELPTGHYVMHTNLDDSVRFTTGMFNLTESSINGVNTITKQAMNSKAIKENSGVTTIPAKILMAAGVSEDYYDNLTQDTSRRIIIDHDGSILDTAIDLPRNIEEQLIPSTENGIDAIGNYFGRVIEEDTNISSNKHAVDLLRQHYSKNVSDRKYYVPFDGNFKPKNSDIKSVRMAKEMNDIYHSLPFVTKQYIESTGGVMIDMREIENILGYHQASISDVWNDRSKLPEPMQKTIRGVFDIFADVTGFNPIKLAVGLEKGSSEIASFTKDIILNRSLFIPMSNLFSNILHLWTAGVPAKHIVPDTKEGLMLAKDYQKTSNKIAQIEFVLLNHKLQSNERAKLTNELQVLKEKLLKSPIRPLVDNGIFNSVTTVEMGSDEDVDFSLHKRILDKVGLTKFEDKVNGTFGKNAVDNILIRKGSVVHNFMTQSLDYGDFVAKYTLYKHLTQRKGISKTNAMEVIRDEFVNYTMNRGREFDWANKVGLTWFLSYKLAIQKVIFRNLRRNFLRTMATYSVGKILPDTAILDKTVIEQNLLFDSSLDYQLSPSNLINGWEQYFWHQLF